LTQTNTPVNFAALSVTKTESFKTFHTLTNTDNGSRNKTSHIRHHPSLHPWVSKDKTYSKRFIVIHKLQFKLHPLLKNTSMQVYLRE